LYGLIHRAIRDCIKENYGNAAWEKVHQDAGTNDSHFVSLQSFPDDIAFGMVAAACNAIPISAEKLLHTLGRHWVLKTAKQEYGPILDFGGRDLLSFLRNLDAMHEQVAISFSNLQQPSFHVTEDKDGTALLHYKSHRDGLSAFVVGLLSGLSEHFGEPIHVEQVKAKADGDDHDVFRIVMET